ncbi:tail sheath stabilizer and completion protein [bacterium]|nr:tail sheath stabilizer and completion protein [bacterium]
MAKKNLDYWYDGQVKRYLQQLIRIFSHFQVAENTSNGVNYNTVPCRYADQSRMVAQILRNNSENAISSAPFIACSIQSLQVARDRIHEPNFVSTSQVAEREFNTNTGKYEPTQGNLYTVQRYMPVPYNLTLQVDIWTTNTDTKLQIMEQILILFNPNIQLQSNDNPLDWSNVFEVELTDVAWSSRSVPQGVDESIDVATLSFAVPIWISPPAKVKKQSIIQQIVTDVHETNSIEDLGFDSDLADFFKQVPDTAEIVTTPGDYKLQIDGASAVLLDSAYNGVVWSDLIEMQGQLSATSKLKLNITNDSDNDLDAVIGSVSVNTLDSTKLVFNIDTETLPANTLSNVNKILDPRTTYPGDGTLDAAVLGQRYLISENLDKEAWPNWNIDAKSNDIIEYDGTKWTIAFDASTIDTVHYITNTYTTKQYKWYNNSWISSHEGVYNTGFWRLLL